MQLPLHEPTRMFAHPLHVRNIIGISTYIYQKLKYSAHTGIYYLPPQVSWDVLLVSSKLVHFTPI